MGYGGKTGSDLRRRAREYDGSGRLYSLSYSPLQTLCHALILTAMSPLVWITLIATTWLALATVATVAWSRRPKVTIHPQPQRPTPEHVRAVVADVIAREAA